MNCPSIPAYDEMLNYDPSFRLLEEARKSWDYIVSDELVHSIQPVNVNFYGLNGIAKEYVVNTMWVEAHLTFKMQGHAHYACIVQFQQMQVLSRKVRKIGDGCVATRRKSSMFIDDGKSMELPEKMVFRGIPSVVRLKRFNNSPCPCGYPASAITNGFPIRFIEDRKLRVKRVHPFEFSERPDKLVERGTQAIEKISNDKWKTVGRLPKLQPDDIPLIFNISLGAKTMRLRLCENPQLLPQRIQVFLRPGGLKVGVGQAHGGYSSL